MQFLIFHVPWNTARVRYAPFTLTLTKYISVHASVSTLLTLLVFYVYILAERVLDRVVTSYSTEYTVRTLWMRRGLLKILKHSLEKTREFLDAAKRRCVEWYLIFNVNAENAAFWVIKMRIAKCARWLWLKVLLTCIRYITHLVPHYFLLPTFIKNTRLHFLLILKCTCY